MTLERLPDRSTPELQAAFDELRQLRDRHDNLTATVRMFEEITRLKREIPVLEESLNRELDMRVLGKQVEAGGDGG